MIRKKSEHNYRRNLKTGIALSLTLVILSFFFLPDPGRTSREIIPPQEVFISVMNVPSTDHKAPPEAPSLNIKETPYFSLAEDDIFLEDIAVQKPEIKSTGANVEITDTKEPRVYTSLPFSPRIILEVLPDQKEEIEGSVKLKLTIGRDGKVKKHAILANSLAGDSSLKAVLKAVYESRWQPVSIEGDYIDYQIEKTYAFN